MNALKLTDHLAAFYPLSTEFKTALDQVLIRKVFKKGDTVRQSGLRPSIWFIVEGLAKALYEDQDGKEHVTRFWKQGQVMLLANGSPSMMTADQIVLLEDSVLTTISSASLVFLYHSFREGPKLSSKILLEDRNQAELKSFLCSLPGQQAYRQFQQIFPARRLMLKDIASYLEITPGRLSEIRKNMR
jgi:CRP-like cAMP-binding protein